MGPNFGVPGPKLDVQNLAHHLLNLDKFGVRRIQSTGLSCLNETRINPGCDGQFPGCTYATMIVVQDGEQVCAITSFE